MARSDWWPRRKKSCAARARHDALDRLVRNPQGSAPRLRGDKLYGGQGNSMQDNLPDLSGIEEQALVLSQAAIQLDQARSGKRDPLVLATALEANVEVWVAIRALVDDPATTLQPNVCENLRRLSVFVASSTFMHGINISDSTLNTLININLQISEGLLEGAKRR